MKTSFSIFLLVLLATFLGCAAPTNLQRPSIQEQPLVPGDRVRVSVSDALGKQLGLAGSQSSYAYGVVWRPGRFVGPLVALDADTLFLEPQIALPLAFVTKVEVSRGRGEKSNVGKGARIGFLVGAALGALSGVIVGGGFGDCYELDGCSKEFALLGGAGGGLLGTLIGARVGAMNPGEVWEEVPLEKVRMSSLR